MLKSNVERIHKRKGCGLALSMFMCVGDFTHPIPNPKKTYENNSNLKETTSKKSLPFMSKHHGNPNSQGNNFQKKPPFS
jgi:hypothetical protein